MPDISELQRQIREARQAVLNALPEIATENAINAKALAERKIRQVGFGAKYSGNRVPAFYFIGEELNAQGRKYLEDKIKKDEKETHVQDGVKFYSEDNGLTWGEFRKAQGLQADHVDLGYTNKMWAGLVPEAPFYQEGKIICRLAGNSVEVINKLSWNYKHYGDFFAKVFGPPELQALTAATVDRIRIILINHGFKK
jgi:hypothetical protein